MRNKTKFLGIIAILTIIGLLFAGCGGSGGDPSTPGGSDDPGTGTPGGGGGGGGGGAGSVGGGKPSTGDQGNNTTDPNAVTGVTLNKSSTLMAVTNAVTETLTATVSPSTVAAAFKALEWTSSDVAIVSLVPNNTNGTVVMTPEGPGTATITVKTVNGGKTASCTVTVVADQVAPTKIELNKGTLTLTAGTTEKLTATITPENATSQGVTWDSDDDNVATVNAEGVVTAVGKGTADITATVNGLPAVTCALTVNAAAPTGIKIDQTGAALTMISDVAASDRTLSATILPAGADQTGVEWEVTDPIDGSVATIVSGTGVLTLVKGGTATITATATADRNKKATATITIIPVPETITIGGTVPATLDAGAEPFTLTATVASLVGGTVPQEVTWSSSDEDIAKVGETTGVVTPVPGPDAKTGSVVITAESTTVPVGGTPVAGTKTLTFAAILADAIEVPATYAIEGVENDEFELPGPVVFDPPNVSSTAVTWALKDSGADGTKLSILANPPKLVIGAGVAAGSSANVVIVCTNTASSKKAECTVTVTVPTTP